MRKFAPLFLLAARLRIYREPQTWGFLELFRIKGDCIASVVATFVQSPYKMDSPWNPR